MHPPPAAPAAGALAVAARRHGVPVATADSLSPDSAMGVASRYGASTAAGHADRLRLSFSGTVEDVRIGAARLGAAWRSLDVDRMPAARSSPVGRIPATERSPQLDRIAGATPDDDSFDE